MRWFIHYNFTESKITHRTIYKYEEVSFYILSCLIKFLDMFQNPPLLIHVMVICLMKTWWPIILKLFLLVVIISQICREKIRIMRQRNNIKKLSNDKNIVTILYKLLTPPMFLIVLFSFFTCNLLCSYLQQNLWTHTPKEGGNKKQIPHFQY